MASSRFFQPGLPSLSKSSCCKTASMLTRTNSEPNRGFSGGVETRVSFAEPRHSPLASTIDGGHVKRKAICWSLRSREAKTRVILEGRKGRNDQPFGIRLIRDAALRIDQLLDVERDLYPFSILPASAQACAALAMLAAS